MVLAKLVTCPSIRDALLSCSWVLLRRTTSSRASSASKMLRKDRFLERLEPEDLLGDLRGMGSSSAGAGSTSSKTSTSAGAVSLSSSSPEPSSSSWSATSKEGRRTPLPLPQNLRELLQNPSSSFSKTMNRETCPTISLACWVANQEACPP